MACRLVLPYEGLVVEVTEFRGIFVLHVHVVGELVEAFLRNLPFVDNNGIVEVAALDQPGLEQRLNLAHEDEGAGIGNFIGEVLHTVERGELAVDELRVERDHRRDGELLIGENDDGRAGFFVAELDFLLDDVEILGGILHHDAYATDILNIQLGATVENGKFRAVDLYEAVVDAHGIEGGHTMLDGAATRLAARHDCAARGIYHVFGDGLNDGFAFQVNALYLISVVFGGGVEGNGEAQTCVQAFSEKGETPAQCFLFGHILGLV